MTEIALMGNFTPNTLVVTDPTLSPAGGTLQHAADSDGVLSGDGDGRATTPQTASTRR